MADQTDLTLPGTIPGLLRRGSPVVTPRGRRGVIAGSYRLNSGRDRVIVCIVEDGMSAMPSYDGPAADALDLDLNDATGRAHAAWRVCDWCSAGSAVGHTGWYVGPGGIGYADGDDVTSYVEYRRDHPLVADLDPDDPRTLPDGSRWVVAEALRRVVLHTWEVTRG